MRIAVGVYHAGFPLKAFVIEELRRYGHDPLDLGPIRWTTPTLLSRWQER